MNKTNVKKLIFEGEGVTVDFKKTITSCEKIARTMVSFANNKGGKLLIGVTDDGTIKGVKSDDEERYMITKAAHFFSRPALEPVFEEVYFDDKLVLVVGIPPSELKPHYALAEDGKWWAYVRVKDKSVLASKIVLEVLKRSSNNQGVLIEYSENESTLLGHLEKAGRITIKECSELLKVGRRRAQNVLVDLILSGLIKINTTEKEEYYTAC
ncbi:ATP-binding protein [Mucilaginibacter rubeus]|uniref:ATP-binding protein n=1 Tax=Mucilaginibacter rubeus TaxID=2027860 RepID=A0AAE6MI72_9SPHI|nr:MULTISPECIES: ATP-binding protein [Mucilaginibacter]QEM03907.1 ATP-binding protein [Mucilaginibacter rubeus]QEM16517.1 ATP-binding protein [Mucilaginibacter gossypii]QTE40715.1 ATP-binding protein [Mucilaginibacter rubeus]QTE47317.1 ATP-binding protein [Mucilaginibacter rubeus]QTE58710.1 ATP-binding protein [Mucilaginibacter rubeus]